MNPLSRAFRALAPLLLANALLAQEPTCRLEGRVLTAHSEPVVGAMVTAERDGTIVAKTGADALGMFVFGKLPLGELVVRAATTDDVGASLVDTVAGPGFVTLHLAPARRVRGSVLDAKGAPLANAFVAAVPLGAPALSAFGVHTRSGADGTFTLPPKPFGPLALRAFHPAHAGAALTLERDASDPVELRMADDEPTAHRFVAEGFEADALAKARLHVGAMIGRQRVPLPPELAEPAIGPDATWTLRGWPVEDELGARMRVPGMPSDPQRQVVTGLRDRTRKFVPSGRSAVPLRGVVQLPDAALPKGGIRLLLRFGEERLQLTTDAQGAFATPFAVPHGDDVLVQSLDARFLVPDARQHEAVGWRGLAGSHAAERTWTVPLQASQRVHGRVVDAQGGPAAGACVRLMSTNTKTLHLFEGGGVPTSLQHAEAWTDRDGRFTLTGFATSDDVLLRITHRDGHRQETFHIGERGEHDVGRLQLGPAATLRGRVLDPAGRPAAGAWVHVRVWSGDLTGQLLAIDRAGTFTLRGLPPGACVVWVLGHDKVLRRVDLVEGEVVDVTLP